MANAQDTVLVENARTGPSEALILSTEALEFVADLVRTFRPRIEELLAARAARQARLDANGAATELGFLEATAAIRSGDWRCAPVPDVLLQRRVEITGPVDRKMIINALNAGSDVFMADLEDATCPTWTNLVDGQHNLYDAIRRTITFEQGPKKYALNEKTALLFVRPRGWHLPEKHVLVDGAIAPGALVDFGLYFFHNAQALLAKGSGPYFYLPKMESHLEARLWNDVFTHAQETLGIPHGTIRATVLIETIPAAFEMEEILYELRDHMSGLNAGRWDYLFSIIKYFRDAGADFVLPDRNDVTMTAPFMRAYTELLVRTCHKRGAFAMGGMAAFIPNRRDPEVTEKALAKVHDDKRREAGDGFDGSWVAHPDLVSICDEEFTNVLGGRPNQLDKLRADVSVTADQLLNVKATPGHATAAGLRAAVDVGVRYLASWLGGNGAAAIHNLMEDAATAEISRSQVWQWVRNEVKLDNGATVTADLVRELLAEVRAELDGLPHLAPACEIFEQVALADEYPDFLTLPAYERI